MPHMVAPNAPRRLPALPTLQPSPLQASPDFSAPVIRPDGLRDDFGYYGGLGGACQVWGNQTPFPGQDATSVNSFAQNHGLHSSQPLDDHNATKWSQNMHTECSALMHDTLNALDGDGWRQQHHGVVGYDAYASSTSPYTASSQLSESEGSDSNSPASFVAEQPLLWQAINNSASGIRYPYATPQLHPHGITRFQEHHGLPYTASHPPTASNVAWATDPLAPSLAHTDETLGECLTLAMLCDPVNPGEKPDYPYPTLIRAAILGSPRRALTLQGIYDALESRWQWFRDHKDDKGWKNSIRHNLSLNKLFRRLEKPPHEPGKGCYWTVDFSAGEGTKRERRRTKRAGLAEKTRLAAAADVEAKAKARGSVECGNREEETRSEPRAQNGAASMRNQQVHGHLGVDPALHARAVPLDRPAAENFNRDASFGGAESHPGRPDASWPAPYVSTGSTGTQGPPTWGTAPSGPQAFGYLFSPGLAAYAGTAHIHAHNVASGPPSSSYLQN